MRYDYGPNQVSDKEFDPQGSKVKIDVVFEENIHFIHHVISLHPSNDK